jgi:hypothetical protein
MSPARFNHMELTLPPGALSKHRAEIAEFYQELFGWESLDVPILGQLGLLLRSDPETSQFILVTEQRQHLRSPGFDHLGLLFDTRAEVDRLLEQCRRKRELDSRVEIKEYDDLQTGDATVHAFYVRFLLPIWFDVQVIDYAEGTEPRRRWRFS